MYMLVWFVGLEPGVGRQSDLCQGLRRECVPLERSEAPVGASTWFTSAISDT